MFASSVMICSLNSNEIDTTLCLYYPTYYILLPISKLSPNLVVQTTNIDFQVVSHTYLFPLHKTGNHFQSQINTGMKSMLSDSTLWKATILQGL